MPQKRNRAKRVARPGRVKPLNAALAKMIRQFGELLETSVQAELRRIAHVMRTLAYIATLTANAANDSGNRSRQLRLLKKLGDQNPNRRAAQ